jgi:peptide/nickel transport system permease protein
MRYALRRLLFFAVTVWAAVSFNFFVPRLMPGSPIQALEAEHPHLNPRAIKALTILLGAHGAHGGILSQYLQYWEHVVTFNFGISITTAFGTPVRTMVFDALPWTLGLLGITTIIAFVAGTFIGLVSAWRRGSLLDSALPPIFVILSNFPYFVLAMLAIFLFATTLNVLPNEGAYSLGAVPSFSLGYIGDVLDHALLPALTILVTSVGGWILTMRNNTISVLAEDYVRMARAKGLKSWEVMWHYAGKNAILPNLTGFAMSFGFIVSGAILVEWVYNYPGVGYMLLNSVSAHDYPLMQALFLLITVAVLLCVLLADIVAAIIDPRTRELAHG